MRKIREYKNNKDDFESDLMNDYFYDNKDELKEIAEKFNIDINDDMDYIDIDYIY